MSISFIVSVILAFGALIFGFWEEGGNLADLFQPTALIIVFGGTFGAMGVSTSMETIKKIPKLFGILLFNKKDDKEKIITDCVYLSNIVRKEGLLALESELQSGKYDEFVVHSLQMVTDGTDGELIRKSLESRIDNMEFRHSKGIKMFEAMAGFAPTMGVLGTVMGLINVMAKLNSNPDDLGPMIAVAFIATLYGVGSANLLWMPFANRLKEIDEDEILSKSMIMEGIMLIYSGSNPMVIEERLRGFMENEKEKTEQGQQ